MQDFKDNKIQIIVSTTVIEVGVNVPNASLMVIENADRFGLATLHQLRGRVGRSCYESYCVLKTKNMGKECRERLGIMVKSNNGFEIAEKDLEIRGPGDFFGIRQHGLPEFKLANLLKDVKLLKLSNDAAKEILDNDPKLELKENKVLKKELFERYNEQLVNIGT
jgi:ATP-dependent DNA helicase RecG